MIPRIVVLGSNFAGLTAALELKERLGEAAKLTVISKDDAFVFTPELIKIAFGLARRVDAVFPLRETMEARGIAFRVASIERIDSARRRVFASGEVPYDYLVIAAGSKHAYESTPGLGPFKGFTHSIFTIDEAEMAAAALNEFAKNPGPVVIGALPGSSFFWLVYEFLFNMAHYVRDRSLDNSPITFVTPEPYIGHFGIGGYGPATRAARALCERLGIKQETNAAIREITRDTVRLADGRELPFRFAMLAPNSVGIDPVRACTEIVDSAGFVKVNDQYQAVGHPEVFAAGAAVSLAPRDVTPIECGAPKTGHLAEEMAKVVAYNIAASINGDRLVAISPEAIDAKTIIDLGNVAMLVSPDQYLKMRVPVWTVPGPDAEWAQDAPHRYFLASIQRGHL